MGELFNTNDESGIFATVGIALKSHSLHCSILQPCKKTLPIAVPLFIFFLLWLVWHCCNGYAKTNNGKNPPSTRNDFLIRKQV
jgi:hypothetical protein